MNKKIWNICGVILLVAVFLFILSPNVFADGDEKKTFPSFDKIFSMVQNFETIGKQNAPIDAEQIANTIRPLESILLGIGTVVLVVVTAIMGIKYMTASPEGRGKLKTQLIGVAVSAVVLFGAYGIWRIAYTLINGII